jgi:hypothetical protein
MKAITIQGAGIDETIIRTDTTTAPGDKSFVLNGVEGKPFRITGITFDGTGFANAGTWAGEVVTKLNMVLRPWANHEHEAKQAEHVKEGRDFFNEKPRPEYYTPYIYPHPLQQGWGASGKSAAASTSKDSGGSQTPRVHRHPHYRGHRPALRRG